ncbi:MAG: ABC transporter permease, partial [Myxococcota bacterium]
MIAAFFKESRSLVPFWIAFAAMVVVSAVADALGPDYVLQPFGTRYDDDSGGYFFVVLLGLLMGHGVVAHEYVNDHIEFLDALPVTRTTLYLGKVLACTMAALGLVVGSALGDVTMDVLGPVPHQLPSWRPLLIEHLLVFATFWFGLGVGMLLSWIRGLAISVVIALMFAGSILTFAIPSLGDAVPLPDTGFGRLTWTRGEASHPFGPPLFWFGIGTLCMVISGWLFTGPGGALVARGSAAMSRLRVVGVVLGSVTLMGLGLLGLLATGGIADLPERLLVVDPPGPLRVVFQPSSAGHVLSMVPSLE